MKIAKKSLNTLTAWMRKHPYFVMIGMIAIIGLIAFVPSMKRAGFSGDDYYLLLGGVSNGPQKFVEMYAYDRPFLGYTFKAIFSLLGTNIHNYQIFALIFNLLASFSVTGLVLRLWPEQKLLSFAAGALFCIFPGFIDHLISFNYSIFLLTIFLSMGSIFLTSVALSAKKGSERFLITFASMIFQLWSVLNLEYYLGLEVLRVVVIYIMIRNRNSNDSIKISIWKTIKNYLPYLAVAAGFFIWRFFFFTSQRRATDLGIFIGDLTSSPIYKLTSILVDWINYSLNITLFSWFVPVYNYVSTLRLKYILFCAAFGLLAGLVTLIVLRIFDKDADAEFISNKTAGQMVIVGLVNLAGVGIPIVFVNRQATLGSFGRYALPSMFGGILLVLCFAFLSLKPKIRNIFLAFLISCGVFVQLGVGKMVGDTWTATKDIWWQISWRAPSIKPGTVLAARLSNVPISEGYYLWGPANLIYNQGKNELQPSIGGQVIYPDYIKSVLADQTQTVDTRSFLITLDPENLLVLSKPAEYSCVHAVDNSIPDLLLDNSSDIQLLSMYSKISQINPDSKQAVPPKSIFGTEPEHGWCYYYQKASLALQKRDYAEIIKLGSEVEQKRLTATDTTEWLPFVLAYAETGDYVALDRTIPMYFDARYTKGSFCTNVRNTNLPISKAANDYLENNICN
jgi:hypothetical protein